MDWRRTQTLRIVLAAGLGCLATWPEVSSAQGAGPGDAASRIKFLAVEGRVLISFAGTTGWVPITNTQVLHLRDRLRTDETARFQLKWSDGGAVAVDASSEFEILEPHMSGAQCGLNLLKGIFSFFHRDKPRRIQIITHAAMAGVEGTEFVIAVETNNLIERTTLWVIDGSVRFSNNQGSRSVTNLQQAVAEPGKEPVVTTGFTANNILQWCFYYPAVLDLRDLPFTAAEENALGESLKAYREGDLLGALRTYPAGRPRGSDAERLYYAELLLSVGRVDKAEDELAPLPAAPASGRVQRLATALRQLIAAVKLQANPSLLKPELASEFLAASYYEQSLGVREISLRSALDLARKAAARSPDFGFAWERVAELEFSFGRTERALEALNKSLALAPRNAQALALEGFLVAAQNKIREATDWFERAIGMDPSLGNAWLGRGLCRIHRGDLEGGREDLLVAAALEPQRALLRSYLGKAYAEENDYPRAAKELERAKRLDSNDPTSWLYFALLNQEHNRINEAVRDLEESQELHDNRRLYRSSLLLDQDRAVRSVNLANIYGDAGMTDVSLREASRAVNADYANYSAHLFLANTYDQLRDPRFVNLRLETAANSEYLIANLLAPISGGTLNSAISDQEYSRLFERNRIGVDSSTEYFSHGDWVQSGAQYGVFDTTSYSLGAFYRTERGWRPNNDVEQRQLSLQLKQQLTPKDDIYLEASQLEIGAGDLVQYYNNVSPFPNLRTQETQEPILTLGYHHQWSPGQHTLVLANWLNDDFRYHNPSDGAILLTRSGGVFVRAESETLPTTFRDRLEVFSVEPQHIWQQENNLAIVGARFQIGHFNTDSLQDPHRLSEFSDQVISQHFRTDFDRWTIYGYDQVQILEPLALTVGAAYDHLTFPKNFLAPPFSTQQSTEDQLSPKAGLIWTPASKTTARFAYTRSLGGASLDQSFRIEPTQVAGFNQALRSLIPESVSGSIPGARFESFDLSLEQKVASETYLGVSGEISDSDPARTIGAFILTTGPAPTRTTAAPSDLVERLDYVERSIKFSIDQLLGDEWSVGARYGLTQAELATAFPEIPESTRTLGFNPRQREDSVFHQVALVANFNHPCGFFSQLEADWYSQWNHGSAFGADNTQAIRRGEDFWDLNLFVGYRFPRRQAELRIGLLNITDRNYHLDPLTFDSELPRGRTLTVRFRFNF